MRLPDGRHLYTARRKEYREDAPTLEFSNVAIGQSLKVFASFASLIRQFANRLIAKEERSKRKLWRNLKLSAFVVGAAPWLIPDPGSQSKNNENELTASECKFSRFSERIKLNFQLFEFSATLPYPLHGEILQFICKGKSLAQNEILRYCGIGNFLDFSRPSLVWLFTNSVEFSFLSS